MTHPLFPDPKNGAAFVPESGSGQENVLVGFKKGGTFLLSSFILYVMKIMCKVFAFIKITWVLIFLSATLFKGPNAATLNLKTFAYD